MDQIEDSDLAYKGPWVRSAQQRLFQTLETNYSPQAPDPIPSKAAPLEVRVLLSACRLFMGTEDPSKLEVLLSQGPEWDRLLVLANEHGVMPLLFRSLGRVDRQLVPHETMARLRMMYMQNAARNIRMTWELLRILDALKDAGIKAVPLKGPVLAEQLYGDVALRQFSDLDILVAREDADKALMVLEENGYRVAEDPRKEKSEKKRAAMLDCLYNYDLTNESFGIHIELHWRLSQSLRHLNADEANIWDRLNIVCLLGKDVLNLSNEDYIIYLSQHGARHLWIRLAWICDFAKLMAVNKGGWFLALKMAKETRNERIFLLGILLVDKLMEVHPSEQHPSEQVIQESYYDEDLTNLSKKIITGIFSSHDSKDSSHDSKDNSFQAVADLVLYKNVLSIREKVAFYFDIVMKPTKPDFDLLPLPDVLFPAYRLIRPVRLMKTYGKAFMRQLKKEEESRNEDFNKT